MSLLLAARRNTFWNTKRFPVAPNDQQKKSLSKARQETLANLSNDCQANIQLEKLTKEIKKITHDFQTQYKSHQKTYEDSLGIYKGKPTVLKKLSEKPNHLITDYFNNIARFQTTLIESTGLLEQIDQVNNDTLSFDQISIMDQKLGEAYWQYLENERIQLYNDPANPFPMRAKLSSLFIVIACTASVIATIASLHGPVIMCASFGIITCLVSSLIAYLNYNLICALPHYNIKNDPNFAENSNLTNKIPTIRLTFDKTTLNPNLIDHIDITSGEDDNTISISLKLS